jgi:hypothetical protein
MKSPRKHLWYVEGLNAIRHKVGDYFWTVSSWDARSEWSIKFGGVPSNWRFVR